MNLRPSGYEATDEGLQAASESINPLESLDALGGLSATLMQAESNQHKNFGQPVVSNDPVVLEDGAKEDLLTPSQAAPVVLEDGAKEDLLTPSQAAARFQVPEYLLRKACSEGSLEHLRVVNALWLAPDAVAAFARSWRTKNGGES